MALVCCEHVQQACALLLSLGEVMHEVENTGEIEQHDSHEDTSLPSLAHFIYTNEGNTEKAAIAAHITDPEWVLDSGASQHVAGDFRVESAHSLSK